MGARTAGLWQLQHPVLLLKLAAMAIMLLPPSALEHVESFLYDSEDTPCLLLLGRLAIAVRAPESLLRARLAFMELWQRRDDQMYWEAARGYCFNRRCRGLRCQNGRDGFWAI